MFRIVLLFVSCSILALSSSITVSQPPPSQPPKLTLDQQVKIKTRDRLEKEAGKFQSEGKLAEARAAVGKSLAIERDVFGDAHTDVAASLAWLMDRCLQAEDFPAAREYGKKALAARKQLHGESHWRTTDAQLDLEDVELRAGLTEKLRADLDEAVRLTGESVRSRDRSEYQKAAEPAEKALALRRAVLGEKHTAYAESLNNLAVLYQAQSLPAKAEPLFVEALAVRKVSLGEKHPAYADSLHNLALLYQSQGEHAKAEPLYMEALAIRKAALGEKHPRYAISLNNLASAYSGQGFHAKAGPLLKEAIGISEDHLEQTAATQSESGQLTHTAATRRYLDNLLSLPRTDAAEVYGVAFRWRGAVTARQTFARATRGTDPASLRTLDELRDVSRRLSNLVNNPPKHGFGVDVPALQKELEENHGALETKLAAQSKDFAKYRESRALRVADIQKLLPADAVLVDFLVYGNKIAAFVITPKSIVRVDLKANSSDIAEMVEDFRSPLSLKRMRPVQGEGDKSALREAVWEPLVPHLQGVNLVLICPDGPLCRVPFAALRGADPKKYLIEEVGIAVIPVPRLLPELLADRPVGAPSLLVVGDVDFSGDPGAGKLPGEVAAVGPTRAGGPLAWKSLPATAGEIRTIGDLFRKSAAGAAVTSLSKGNATEAAIRRAAGKHRYLHFATHGFFAAPTGRAASDPDGGVWLGDRVRGGGLSPGLMCGLVCAGANEPTPDDDGVLTALEVADLDLSGVELAVLSACETGLGAVAGGDGVLGLQRAFQLAGTRTTVTSLWKMPDAATGALMARFYENRLGKGMPALQALREAQLWVLNEGVKAGVLTEEPKNGSRTPPLFWAAFVLAGDWR